MKERYSQNEMLINLLRANRNFSTGEYMPLLSWEIQKRNTDWGFLGTSADRNARRLAESGILGRGREGKYATYWYLDPDAEGEQARFAI
tara:strand:+ start:385 stop:651 length:267 start_codon:yes stop_codon:yes gene_type:complete